MSEDIEIDSETLIKLLQGAYVAIDGLWFLEVEKNLGFGKAFELDLEVWKSWGNIIIRRIRRSLGIEGDDISTIVKIIKVLYLLEGSKHEVVKTTSKSAVIRVSRCHWYDNLKKAGREKIVNCEDVDAATLPAWAEALNPKLSIKQTRSIPRGDKICEFTMEILD